MMTYTTQTGRTYKRAPWGHVRRSCIYCGKGGPRTHVLGGWAHKKCIKRVSR